ncbi:MAG TPA: hypothetical protein VGM92_03660, partial [Candidatus Kapabacteria bacterium]
MRSRKGLPVRPRFYNGPSSDEVDKRIDLLVVGGFQTFPGHRDHTRKKNTYPCLGEECRFCRQNISKPEDYEYIGVLLDGQPKNWCVPPDWAHQLGEQPWLWLKF